MTTVTFDTLKFVETLKASGFDDTQAKGMAQAIRDVQSSQVEELAAKRDLKELESQVATKSDVARLESQIKEMEIRMVKWMVGTSGAIFALLKLFPGGH